MSLNKPTFKQAKGLLWKIEKEFNLNLLTQEGYRTAFEIYDLWVIVARDFYKKWGREMLYNDNVDWKIFKQRIAYCAKNN